MFSKHALVSLISTAALVGFMLPHELRADICGNYIEARTCQVYTGPCFANGEVGLAGHDAVMAWNITEGRHNDIDLGGLNVVVVVKADDTLGFGGLDEARSIKSLILVDKKASDRQREALIDFARQRTGKAGKAVTRVVSTPIDMSLDTDELTGRVQAGKAVQLSTRKARKGDCICSNESAYYPPLASVTNFAPGVTIEGEVTARPLGTRWSIPDTRSAYMGTFSY